jgi:hypothetical protein
MSYIQTSVHPLNEGRPAMSARVGSLAGRVLSMLLFLTSSCVEADNRAPFDSGVPADGTAGDRFASAELEDFSSCPTASLAVPKDAAAQTPRERQDLEALAIRIEGGPTASPQLYGRLVADVGVIEKSWPELGPTTFVPPAAPNGFELLVSREAYEAIARAEYHAWDCANERYSAVVNVLSRAESTAPIHTVEVSFGGTFNLELVANDYAALPGVYTVFHQPTTRRETLCAARSGNRIRYFLITGTGDCASGCTELSLAVLESSTAASLQLLGIWSSIAAELPPPDWATIPSYCW